MPCDEAMQQLRNELELFLEQTECEGERAHLLRCFDYGIEEADFTQFEQSLPNPWTNEKVELKPMSAYSARIGRFATFCACAFRVEDHEFVSAEWLRHLGNAGSEHGQYWM